jgi:hypothetical protein
LSALRLKMDETLSSAFHTKCNELSTKCSKTTQTLVENIKSKSGNLQECNAKISEAHHQFQSEWKFELNHLKDSIRSEFQQQVESISDDVRTVKESMESFDDKLEAEYSNALTKIKKDVMWPFAVAGRIDIL